MNFDDAGDDDYWNSNARKSNTGLFDDVPGASETSKKLELLKKQIEAADQDQTHPAEIDTIETVDWGGAKINSGQKVADFQSISYSKNSSNLLSTTPQNVPTKNADTGVKLPVSNARYGHQKSPSVGSVGASSVSSTVSADIASRTKKKDFTETEFATLTNENVKMKKKLQQLYRDKYRTADIQDTIDRMKSGEPFILEYFKSHADKIRLLDAILDFGDGDLITAVVLFLKNTLSYAFFQEQLLKKPSAANHYVAYLKSHFKHDELSTTLYALGRKEEAAMVEYQMACKRSTSSLKISSLKKCLSSTFSADPSLNNECQLLTEYVGLLERQQPIDDSDDKAIETGKEQKFKQFPKTASVVDQSVLTTLYYCCLYHYELPQNSFASPLAMREYHRLSDKQFCWVAVKALSRQKRWNDIQQLMTTKSFLGGTKVKTVIPIDRFLLMLSNSGATPEMLSGYVRLIDDSELKLKIASKYKCHQVVVDCLVAAKDRASLIEYSAKLDRHTPEFYYAEAALKNSSVRWKN